MEVSVYETVKCKEILISLLFSWDRQRKNIGLIIPEKEASLPIFSGSDIPLWMKGQFSRQVIILVNMALAEL
jgi:hypothetical protein